VGREPKILRNEINRRQERQKYFQPRFPSRILNSLTRIFSPPISPITQTRQRLNPKLLPPPCPLRTSLSASRNLQPASRNASAKGATQGYLRSKHGQAKSKDGRAKYMPEYLPKCLPSRHLQTPSAQMDRLYGFGLRIPHSAFNKDPFTGKPGETGRKPVLSPNFMRQ